jgi:hypothetical protein
MRDNSKKIPDEILSKDELSDPSRLAKMPFSFSWRIWNKDRPTILWKSR